MEHCKVSAIQVDATEAVPLHLNRYVVVSPDTYVEMRCEGNPTKRQDIEPGSFVVEFGSKPCQVEGPSGWVLSNFQVHRGQGPPSAMTGGLLLTGARCSTTINYMGLKNLCI